MSLSSKRKQSDIHFVFAFTKSKYMVSFGLEANISPETDLRVKLTQSIKRTEAVLNTAVKYLMRTEYLN